jgi:hypothetical protein
VTRASLSRQAVDYCGRRPIEVRVWWVGGFVADDNKEDQGAVTVPMVGGGAARRWDGTETKPEDGVVEEERWRPEAAGWTRPKAAGGRATRR